MQDVESEGGDKQTVYETSHNSSVTACIHVSSSSSSSSQHCRRNNQHAMTETQTPTYTHTHRRQLNVPSYIVTREYNHNDFAKYLLTALAQK